MSFILDRVVTTTTTNSPPPLVHNHVTIYEVCRIQNEHYIRLFMAKSLDGGHALPITCSQQGL